MTSERSLYGLLVSALGAALLACSLFLPWYRVSVTGAGARSLGQLGSGLVADLGGLHATHAGQHVWALTAAQALGALPVILLVLAGLALLDALVPLARAHSVVPAGAGGAVVVLGTLAGGCVLYRMIVPPASAGPLSLSLREGAWLSLLGSLMVVLGGMWPRSLPAISPAEAFGGDIWASLMSGPGAPR